MLPEIPGTALVCIGCGPIPQEQGHFYSAGLHPWDVTGSDEEQFRALEKLLAQPQVLAVGECGFDRLKGPSHELQEKAFIRQFELSENLGKPMILHVVRDFDTVIRLKKELKPTQKWLIHGFRGGSEQMEQLHRSGLEVSFGLKYNPESLKIIPSDRLFLETDGKGSIDTLVQEISQIRKESVDCIERQLQRNYNYFLKA
ncbi:MAG: TatD family hydrolase [Bacteroidaceae bacterium]|nr:TatD family hydrolase [Bacteroidaceae bacterium]